MLNHHWRFPYKKNGRFMHYLNRKSNRRLWYSIYKIFQIVFSKTTGKDKLKRWVEPFRKINFQLLKNPSITWLGHSTFLIRIANKVLLTDPAFGSISNVLKRLTPLGIPKEELPKVDAVLISHNHRDHMDEPSLKFLEKHHSPIFFIPEGTGDWFRSKKLDNFKEFNWWNKEILFDNVTCTFLPAVHWSCRGFFDENKSLWGSWMIQSSDTNGIFFSGDTAYDSHFKAIAENYPNIDVALMAVGPIEPNSHLSPEDAGRAFLDLNAKIMIPMHWGAFKLDDENDPLEMINRLQLWWKKNLNKIDQAKLSCMKVGEHLILEEILPKIFKIPLSQKQIATRS